MSELDRMSIIVIVKYDDNHPFTFRCRQWHLPGEHVCVFTRNKYQNVEVIRCEVQTERYIRNLAYAIGYSDIKEIYCEQPIELKGA